MIQPLYPWPGPAVVRCNLRCNYCALEFVRDFDRFDDVRAHLHPFGVPIDEVTRRELATVVRRTWYGRRFSESQEKRAPVKCPHCGSTTRMISREPINVDKESCVVA